jgi:hypothetical protein
MILYVVVPGIQKFESGIWKFESGIQKLVSGIREFASPEIGPMFSVPCHSERSEESAGRRGQQNEIPCCARNDKPSTRIPITNRRDSQIPRLPNYTSRIDLRVTQAFDRGLGSDR